MDDELKIGEKGTIRLPEKKLTRWGLAPGAGYVVKETADGLLLRPSEPPLAKIYLEPTTKCNLQCRTCMRTSWDEPGGQMSVDTYRRLLCDLGKAPRLPAISFWGIGEPLLHPEIIEMIRLANSQGMQTELVTNGLLLSKEISYALLRSGLDRIVVSIDGVSAKSYGDIRLGANLETIKKNVGYLNSVRRFSGLYKMELGIEYVLSRSNLADLPELPGLARSLGASFILVTNVLPYSEEFKEEILYGIAATEWPHTARRFGTSPDVFMPRVDVHSDTREALTRFLLNAGTVGLRAPAHTNLEANCPFIWEAKAAIAWNGDVSPCVALMHSHTCYVLGRRKTVRRYSLGNILQDNILDIWNKEEYRKFRRRVLEFDFSPCIHCDCEMAESNEEDCIGSPFPTCGDCLWARGVVLCP